MKVFYVATLLALGCVSPLNAADKGKHLFILSGQSNMANLDPSVSFTPILEKEFGKERVTVVKDAQKGQPLSRWYKKWKPVQGDAPATTGDLYDRLMKKVNEAINDDEYTTVTLIWMQGERDAKDKQGEEGSVGGPRAGEAGGDSSGSPRCVRIFRIGPGSVMNAMSRMSPPHPGHSSGKSSPTRAMSFPSGFPTTCPRV